jgi:tRNA uridine 5-carbamoylmethylation protein Kti12
MDLAKFQDLDLVLVCGLPGAGKSRFSSRFFRESGRRCVSRRLIRRMLYEMTTFGERWSEQRYSAIDEILVKHVERKIIEHLLQNRLAVLAENTSISAASRKVYLAIARQMHRSTGVIFLDTPVATCLERNRAKPDPVPERVIAELAAALELPDPREGFDQLAIAAAH